MQPYDTPYNPALGGLLHPGEAYSRIGGEKGGLQGSRTKQHGSAAQLNESKDIGTLCQVSGMVIFSKAQATHEIIRSKGGCCRCKDLALLPARSLPLTSKHVEGLKQMSDGNMTCSGSIIQRHRLWGSI